MTTKQKIIQFLENQKISKRDFYRQTGLSNGFLDSGKHIGSDNLKLIVDNYPNLSLEWLVMGKGSMFKNEENLSVIQEEQAPYYTKNNKNNEIIEIQKQLLESQAREIKLLQEKIDRLESDKSIVSKTT